MMIPFHCKNMFTKVMDYIRHGYRTVYDPKHGPDHYWNCLN